MPWADLWHERAVNAMKLDPEAVSEIAAYSKWWQEMGVKEFRSRRVLCVQRICPPEVSLFCEVPAFHSSLQGTPHLPFHPSFQGRNDRGLGSSFPAGSQAQDTPSSRSPGRGKTRNSITVGLSPSCCSFV